MDYPQADPGRTDKQSEGTLSCRPFLAVLLQLCPRLGFGQKQDAWEGRYHRLHFEALREEGGSSLRPPKWETTQLAGNRFLTVETDKLAGCGEEKENLAQPYSARSGPGRSRTQVARLPSPRKDGKKEASKRKPEKQAVTDVKRHCRHPVCHIPRGKKTMGGSSAFGIRVRHGDFCGQSPSLVGGTPFRSIPFDQKYHWGPPLRSNGAVHQSRCHSNVACYPFHG